MPFLLSRTQFLAGPSRAVPCRAAQGQRREEMGEGDYGPEGPEWRQRGFEDARRRGAAAAVMMWARGLAYWKWSRLRTGTTHPFTICLLSFFRCWGFFFNPSLIFSLSLSLFLPAAVLPPPRSTVSENNTRGQTKDREREREEKKWKSGERKGGRKEGRS